MRNGSVQRGAPQQTGSRQDQEPLQGVGAGLSRIPPPLRLFAVMMAILTGWYGIIGTVLANIEVDLAIRPTAEQLPPGGSVAVGMAARLIEHQVVERSFTPNDPIFYPTGLTRRTPAFQSSMMLMIADFVAAKNEANPSPALSSASRYLATAPTTWWLRPGWPPIGPSAERQYRSAIEALSAHNRDAALARGQPVIAQALQPGSLAALLALLERVELEAAQGNRILRSEEAGTAAVQLSSARGTAFAAAMLMRGIRDDNAGAIRLSGKAARWGEALDALDVAASMNPVFVGDDDLVKSGYSLLLAGSAMRDILEGQG